MGRWRLFLGQCARYAFRPVLKTFYHVMNDLCSQVERHPQVVHLPAPHIWQLTPSLASQASSTTTTPSTSNAISDSLVVTLELHVKEDLGDDDVLMLTKWAWERCVSALGNLKDLKGDSYGGPEVTVGIVRG